MKELNIRLRPIAYRQVEAPWLGNLRPYEYQKRVVERVEQALEARETLCLLVVTPTGSGKTLAAYAASIRGNIEAFGVYPTNELIKDQERALQEWLDPRKEYRLLRIDSRELDRWEVAMGESGHAPTLETLLNWHPTVLTNPDILFYVFFGLYGAQKEGLNTIQQQLFTRIGQYRIFIFDEFHLYNIKQMADTAFLMGTLHAIQPNYGRVFLFASATPQATFRELLVRMGLPVETITGEPVPEGPDTRRVAQSLYLTFLPADLRAWRGSERLMDFLPKVKEFLRQHPAARLVVILDSVADAMRLASTMREHFPDRPVGEVHGFSSPQERDSALLQPITVGTSTIEVGVDFVGERAKDVLLFEARTSSQFIQRLGRIARHKKPSDSVPNWAVVLVPEYVYHFLTEKLIEGKEYDRKELYQWIEEAYRAPEDFKNYLQHHAPAEFYAARKGVIEPLFMRDERSSIREALGRLSETLTGVSERQARARYDQYQKERILAPLLTFRGSGLEVAILDERGTDAGFPIKRYDLMFLLRRGIFEELSPEEFEKHLEMLQEHWPEEVAMERRYSQLIESDPEKLLGVYGYFRLKDLLDKPRQVWFEAPEEAVKWRKGRVAVLEELEVYTRPEVHLRRLNARLRKKKLVAWVVDRKPVAIRLGRSLPPLFEVYELRIRARGGSLVEGWSIAFNQNAFFMECIWDQSKEKGSGGLHGSHGPSLWP